jgi:hypothetical protein
LLNYQQDYTAWFRRVREARVDTAPRRLVRQLVLQLAINAALIAGLFLSATLVNRLDIEWLDNLPRWTGGRETALWFAAMLCSLPVIIATLRKIEAFSMLLSEMTIRREPGVKGRMAVRAMLANTTLFTGIVGLGLFVLALSSVLLPSWEVFAVLGGIAVLVALLLRTFFIRIYSRAQVAIRETLSREPLDHAPESDRPLPSLLENAELVTVQIGPQSPALGKQIRELELRTRTGATAVAIRRGAETVISPEPDFDFQLHDQVLLIGGTRQLEEARKLFADAGA